MSTSLVPTTSSSNNNTSSVLMTEGTSAVPSYSTTTTATAGSQHHHQQHSFVDASTPQGTMPSTTKTHSSSSPSTGPTNTSNNNSNSNSNSNSNNESRRHHRSNNSNSNPQYNNALSVPGSTASPTKRRLYFGPYELLNTLGEGEFGKVKLGVHSTLGEQVAIKLIRRSAINDKDKTTGGDKGWGKVKREVNVLKIVKHPNIVTLYDVIENDKYIGIVLEFASGGELFDHILAHRYLKERDACKIFAQLVSGVSYMHAKQIVHRDLKLENLLLDHNRNIIITDFGFANRFTGRDDDLMNTSCGSPCYAAPELVVQEGKYQGHGVDVWSCGVILYAMLAGYLPFDDDPSNPEGDNINLLYKYILATPLTFPDWISQQPRDLLLSVLVPDPRKRASLDQVKQHPWLERYRPLFSLSVEELEAKADEKFKRHRKHAMAQHAKHVRNMQQKQQQQQQHEHQQLQYQQQQQQLARSHPPPSSSTMDQQEHEVILQQQRVLSTSLASPPTQPTELPPSDEVIDHHHHHHHHYQNTNTNILPAGPGDANPEEIVQKSSSPTSASFAPPPTNVSTNSSSSQPPTRFVMPTQPKIAEPSVDTTPHNGETRFSFDHTSSTHPNTDHQQQPQPQQQQQQQQPPQKHKKSAADRYTIQLEYDGSAPTFAELQAKYGGKQQQQQQQGKMDHPPSTSPSDTTTTSPLSKSEQIPNLLDDPLPEETLQAPAQHPSQPHRYHHRHHQSEGGQILFAPPPPSLDQDTSTFSHTQMHIPTPPTSDPNPDLAPSPVHATPAPDPSVLHTMDDSYIDTEQSNGRTTPEASSSSIHPPPDIDVTPKAKRRTVTVDPTIDKTPIQFPSPEINKDEKDYSPPTTANLPSKAKNNSNNQRPPRPSFDIMNNNSSQYGTGTGVNGGPSNRTRSRHRKGMSFDRTFFSRLLSSSSNTPPQYNTENDINNNSNTSPPPPSASSKRHGPRRKALSLVGNSPLTPSSSVRVPATANARIPPSVDEAKAWSNKPSSNNQQQSPPPSATSSSYLQAANNSNNNNNNKDRNRQQHLKSAPAEKVVSTAPPIADYREFSRPGSRHHPSKARKVMEWFRHRTLAKDSGNYDFYASSPASAQLDPWYNSSKPPSTADNSSQNLHELGNTGGNSSSTNNSSPKVVVTSSTTNNRNNNNSNNNNNTLHDRHHDRLEQYPEENQGSTMTATPTSDIDQVDPRLSTDATRDGHRPPSSHSNISFHESKLAWNTGAFSDSSLTQRPPLSVFREIQKTLWKLGIDAVRDGDFKYRCVRRGRKRSSVLPFSSNGMRSSSENRRSNHQPLYGSVGSSNTIRSFFSRRHSSSNASISNLEVSDHGHSDLSQSSTSVIPPPPFYGDNDSGAEIRFTIEITRLKNLTGIYNVDVRRLKGSVWDFKTLYHAIMPLLELHRKD